MSSSPSLANLIVETPFSGIVSKLYPARDEYFKGHQLEFANEKNHNASKNFDVRHFIKNLMSSCIQKVIGF